MKKIVKIITFSLLGLILNSCQNNETLNPSFEEENTDFVYHTVTFDSLGGSEVSPQRVLDGNPIKRVDSPLLEGFSFQGWYKESSYDSIWDFDVDRVYSDLTLYAKWLPIEEISYTESLVYQLNEETNTYTIIDVGDESDIIIPPTYNDLPVDRIQGEYGTGAFARKEIRSVIIPDSIIEIGQNTFANCNKLESVNISENSALRIIGRNAFSGCSSLKSLYVPKGVEQILDSAFNNCGSIEFFEVDEVNAFYKSDNGHLIDINNVLIKGVNNVTVPEGVIKLEEASFRRCSLIDRLYIPTSVNEIGNYFIANSNINTIFYSGNEASWDGIKKTDFWNYGNRDVQIIFGE